MGNHPEVGRRRRSRGRKARRQCLGLRQLDILDRFLLSLGATASSTAVSALRAATRPVNSSTRLDTALPSNSINRSWGLSPTLAATESSNTSRTTKPWPLGEIQLLDEAGLGRLDEHAEAGIVTGPGKAGRHPCSAQWLQRLARENQLLAILEHAQHIFTPPGGMFRICSRISLSVAGSAAGIFRVVSLTSSSISLSASSSLSLPCRPVAFSVPPSSALPFWFGPFSVRPSWFLLWRGGGGSKTNDGDEHDQDQQLACDGEQSTAASAATGAWKTETTRSPSSRTSNKLRKRLEESSRSR